MKNVNLVFGMFVLAVVIIFSSCEEKDPIPQSSESTILPERFKVDIPKSLSSDSYKAATLKSTEADTLKGNEIYENLSYFIAIGEGAADIVESIIRSIRVHNIESVIELTYTSDEDNRIKHLVVNQGVEYDNRNWEYQLSITDMESEGETDGGIGMQVFWDNSPIEGIAVIKPYNLNRNDAEDAGLAMYSVEYSEKKLGDYEAYMIIQIANLTLPNAETDSYAVDAIKMFVGKNGDIVDVYGNSNHPNARFFTDETGFNWAFVASGNESQDIAVAEVALPPSTLDASLREVILKDYSIKNVLTAQINTWFIDNYGIRPDSSDLQTYLMNADAPGYFNNNGFIQGGTAPNSSYDAIEGRLSNLTPYNPKIITDLEIEFLQ